MKRLIIKVVLLFASLSLTAADLRVAVVGEPEELRLKVEAALFNSPYCKIIELNKRKDALNEIKMGQLGVLDEESVAKAGKLLGAEKFLTVYQKGEFSSLRLIDIATSSVEGAWVSDSKSDREGKGLKMETAKDYSALVNKMLEGLAVQRALAELSGGDSKKIKVQIKLPKSTFKFGDKFYFDVVSSEDGYLTLIDIQPDGSILQLLPNKTGQSNQIKAEEPFRFPPEDIDLKVSPPAGKDSIKAIVTKKPLNLFNKADLDNESISSVKPGSGIRAGKGLNMTIKKVPAGDWGIDEVKFQTLPQCQSQKESTKRPVSKNHPAIHKKHNAISKKGKASYKKHKASPEKVKAAYKKLKAVYEKTKGCFEYSKGVVIF